MPRCLPPLQQARPLGRACRGQLLIRNTRDGRYSPPFPGAVVVVVDVVLRLGSMIHQNIGPNRPKSRSARAQPALKANPSRDVRSIPRPRKPPPEAHLVPIANHEQRERPHSRGPTARGRPRTSARPPCRPDRRLKTSFLTGPRLADASVTAHDRSAPALLSLVRSCLISSQQGGRRMIRSYVVCAAGLLH